MLEVKNNALFYVHEKKLVESGVERLRTEVVLLMVVGLWKLILADMQAQIRRDSEETPPSHGTLA